MFLSGCGYIQPVVQPVVYQNYNTFTNRDKTLELGVRYGILNAYAADVESFDDASLFVSSDGVGLVDMIFHMFPDLVLYGSAGGNLIAGAEYIFSLDSGTHIVAGASYGFGSERESGHSTIIGESEIVYLNADVDYYNFNVDLVYEYMNSNRRGICIRPGAFYNSSTYSFSRHYDDSPYDKTYIDRELGLFGVSLKVGIRAGNLEFTAGGVLMSDLVGNDRSERHESDIQPQFLFGTKVFF